MNAQKVDILNIGLIILSLLIAFLLPFQLFLFAYAVLGPLHYLTELNWLDRKAYFVQDKKWIWLIAAMVFLVTIPFVFELQALEPLLAFEAVNLGVVFLKKCINGFILLAFVIAIALIFFKKKRRRLIIIGMGIIGAILLQKLSFYNIWVGVFLPTVIHVYLFTIIFMLFGALKSNSKIGIASVVLAVLCPLIILLINITPESYHFSDFVKNLYVDNNFHVVNARLAGVLGVSNGSSFYFYELGDLKIQIFIAFAYTYHYLNWFSKTSLIGWHKNLTTTRTVAIVVFWICSVFLFWYDYKVGVLVLLFLSMMHVFLEFPLNMVSIKGIYAMVRK